eukprot:4381554-Alexandrium_andersonii.AAC.1
MEGSLMHVPGLAAFPLRVARFHQWGCLWRGSESGASTGGNVVENDGWWEGVGAGSGMTWVGSRLHQRRERMR